MAPRDETRDSTQGAGDDGEAGQRGFLVVFSKNAAFHVPVSLDAGVLAIGRESSVFSDLPDDRLSRKHAVITLEPSGGFRIQDLDSRNGTFVDGKQVRGTVHAAAPRVIRVADTLLVPCGDVTTARAPSGGRGTPIIGAKMRSALDAVERAAVSSSTVILYGESGTGKELAARTFHARGPHAEGPFVAVNCAAIPVELAERLFFGTKRGAYSGATTDAIGHVQAANHGVLFLDEAGELDLGVQAKLLRFLETREVTPLGATSGQSADVRVCLATHKNLREAVGAGRFRANLYHRMTPPEVVLPPLRVRLDEITHHVVDAIDVGAPGLPPHAKLVETCVLRAWPGNVRELRRELQQAAATARAEGADRVRVEHLSEHAGRPFDVRDESEAPKAENAPAASAERPYVKWSQSITREQLERALADSGGNATTAARTLGMQRSQLYREMARHSIKRSGRDDS